MNFKIFSMSLRTLLGFIIKEDAVVFGHAFSFQYYAWNHLPQTAYCSRPLKLIKKLIHDALGHDGIPTTRYVCYKREARRKILNFAEMVISLKSNFPEYNWERIKDHMSLVDQQIFASIKLTISRNGSHYF